MTKLKRPSALCPLFLIAFSGLILSAHTAQANPSINAAMVQGDKIDDCKKVVNRSKKIYKDANSAVITRSPLVISYCNLGAYVVKSVTLTVHRKDGTDEGDGWWNKIYDSKINENMPINKGGYFYGNTLEKGYQYKVKLTYNIASGDKEKCTYDFTAGKEGFLRQLASSGTADKSNRCRQLKNMKADAKNFFD